MKNEMKKYFDELISVWEGFNKSLPKIQYNEDAKDIIYVGELDEDDYISWKPVEKKSISDFKEIEETLEIKLRGEIKEYFNSYWFAELAGFYKGFNIILEPVLPGIEINNFVVQLIGYKGAHEGKLDNILIGLEVENNYLVVVDNLNGNIKLEDYESGNYEVIAKSLEDLISNIKLNKQLIMIVADISE